MNSEYLKEKIKVELELFKLYMIVLVALAGGIVSLLFNNSFQQSPYYLYILYMGLFFLTLLAIGCLYSYIQVTKNLKKLL